MPIRHYARPVLSVLTAWSFAAATEAFAEESPLKEPPRAEESSQAGDKEGVTRIANQGGPVGIVWLRDFAGLGQLFRGKVSGPAQSSDAKSPPSDSSAPGNVAPTGQGPRLSTRMLQRLPTTSVPVMVAPLDSCTPIDAGQIEDLLFADPATADRIIRAAGQGFRVVVLSPVADPNPSPEPHDCPRPVGVNSPAPIAIDRNHPEPTPIQQDPEGRVQMRTVPRPIARNQNTGAGDAATAATRPQPSPLDVSRAPSDQPGIVITSRRGSAPRPAKPAPGLLVPPAPEFDVSAAFPIAISPEPPRVIADLSPSDHLRLAAGQLARQGLTEEADQLRNKARELDQQIDRRLAVIRSQQEQLAAEAARLTAIRDSRRTIRIGARIVEVDRKRMTSPEGIALVRQHLQEKFDEKAPIWSQVTSAAVFPEFIREAGQKGFLNVLSAPEIITTPGQKATIQVGSQIVVPGEQPQTRDIGIHFTVCPHLDDEGRIRLEASPEVSRLEHASSVTVAGQVIPGLATRRTSTEVSLSPGQTIAIGGFHSPVPHLETDAIRQAAGEVVDRRARNYEILFLVTPMAATEAK